MNALDGVVLDKNEPVILIGSVSVGVVGMHRTFGLRLIPTYCL